MSFIGGMLIFLTLTSDGWVAQTFAVASIGFSISYFVWLLCYQSSSIKPDNNKMPRQTYNW